MAWNEWIAKHPKTVLAVWVVLIVVYKIISTTKYV